MTGTNGDRCDYLPLEPHPEASWECLSVREGQIIRALERRGYPDAAVCAGVEATMCLGVRLLQTGKAAQMTPSQRAAFLWITARRAASRVRLVEKAMRVHLCDPRILSVVEVRIGSAGWKSYFPTSIASEAGGIEVVPCWESVLSASKEACPALYRLLEAYLRAGSLRKAAQELGISPHTLRRRIKKLGPIIVKSMLGGAR